MNPTLIAIELLALALVMASLAAIGEITATRQVARETYRFVPLIRLLRRARWVAGAAISGFSAATMFYAPELSVPVGAFAIILGALVVAPLLRTFNSEDLVTFGVLPTVVVMLTVANLGTSALAQPVGLQLGVPALIVSVLIAVEFFIIRHYRNYRDLLLLVQG